MQLISKKSFPGKEAIVGKRWYDVHNSEEYEPYTLLSIRFTESLRSGDKGTATRTSERGCAVAHSMVI